MRETINVTVNGEPMTATVPHRTQLAEVLRDHLDLTGTHLGCEQGVCGACTVIMDGKPVRSCITFAGNCDGADIETIEASASDHMGQMLVSAFSRHHALQCGFCTPGMLATSRDILTRFRRPDENTVRHELSGNLCRCTGYQGIVAAIVDVGKQMNDGSDAQLQSENAAASRPRFTPFTPRAVKSREPTGTASTHGTVSQDKDWTVVARGFELNHPEDQVWNLFSDVARIASCVPGATIHDVGEDRFSGSINVSFGPIEARFGGSGTYFNDAGKRKGFLSGSGADGNGQSNVKGELHYETVSAAECKTLVDVELRFQIQGLLAQFNRPELVTGFIDVVLQRFIANCHVVLSGGTADNSRNIGAFSLVLAMLKTFLKRHTP